MTRQRTAWRCHSLPLASGSRYLGQSRDEQVKERVAEKVSHIGQTWEQVWTRDRETEAAGRAVEVGKRQRHCAGHRQLEAANCGRGQRLGESVGSLVAGRDVDEAEGALVDDLVAQAMVSGVDVGALAAVGEDVGAELDARLVVLEEGSRS